MNLENIQQRGSALIVDVTRNGKRHRVTCETMEEALKVKKQILVSDDQIAGAGCWTLQQAYDKCYPVFWKEKANEKNAVRNAKFALEFFKSDTPLNEVTTLWIDEWRQSMKDEGTALATINRRTASLSKMLSYARECHEDSHYAKTSKQVKIRREREAEGRGRFISQTEEETVLTHLSQWGLDDHAEVVCVLVDTGLRPSECWRLAEKDVNFDLGKHGVITTWKTKNHKPRTVPLTLRAKEIITRRIDVTVKGQPLFPFNNRWMNRTWDRVRTKMGLAGDKNFIAYILRHTCASRLIQRGVKLPVVQEWLGHKTLAITQRYAQLSPDNLFDAVNVLE